MKIRTRLHQLANTNTRGWRPFHRVLLAIAALAMASVSHGQVYRTGAIDGDGAFDITPYAVNDHGVVVGVANSGNGLRAFRWEDGTFMRLQVPEGALGSTASDINDEGLIVGSVRFPGPGGEGGSGYSLGAFWTVEQEGSTLTLLDYDLDRGAPPPHAPGKNFPSGGSVAWGVNNAGLIVGWAGWDSRWIDFVPECFGGAMTNGGAWSTIFCLKHPSTGNDLGAHVFDVNDHGVILARPTGLGADRGVIGTGGSDYQFLEVSPSFQGLSNEGHVVGYLGTGEALPGPIPREVVFARMWDGSKYIDLDSSPSEALAVNDLGFAVGRRIPWKGQHYRHGEGMLYEPGADPKPLGPLASAGWRIFSGTDINNEGMIVGVGEYQGEQTAYWMSPSAGGLFLEGTVRDENGKLMSDLTVIAEDTSGSQKSTTTDADGYYSINLPNSRYSVWIDPWDGFKPQSDVSTVNPFISSVVLDQPREVDFVKTPGDTTAVSSMYFLGTDLIVVFSSEPDITGWIVEGTQGTPSFSIDLSSKGVVQEVNSPGHYFLRLDTTDLGPDLFLRIRKP